jgi:polysaccharide export outer membrane protein
MGNEEVPRVARHIWKRRHGPGMASVALCIAFGGGCATSPSEDAGSGPGPARYVTLPGSAAERPAAFAERPSAAARKDDASYFVSKNEDMLALRARDYQVGPGDLLEVSIFEWELTEETRTLAVRVSQSGTVTLPTVGTVEVASRSAGQIQDDIRTRLAETGMIQDPRVAVTVTEYRSRAISVLGAVNSPGVYAIYENATTLLDILSLAGGLTQTADLTANVLREVEPGGDRIRYQVDLNELMRTGRAELNVALGSGDVVFVPESESAFVYGEVNRPGSLQLNQPLTVLEAIASVGGMLPSAQRTGVRLLRTSDGDRQLLQTIDLTRIESGQAPDVELAANDIVIVPESGGRKLMLGAWEIFSRIFSVNYRIDSNN